MKDYLEKGLEILNIDLEEEKIEDLVKYFELLKEKNKITNLTAIRDDKGIIEKHFLDSLLLQNLIPENAKSAIDIGTGAGFPGMILAIINPQIDFTLMDSVGKKMDFLREVAEELNLKNVDIQSKRAEDFIKEEDRRENYDLGLCRGVAKLRIINEYVLPFLKVGGVFLAQKMECSKEIEEAENSLKELKSKVKEIKELKLPYSKDKRIIIEIIRQDKIDKRYPRRAGVPTKRPL